MSNPFDDRLLTHYREIQAIHSGHLPFPRMAIIYPTYGCHFDCVGCEYASLNAQGYRMFPIARLVSLLTELRSAGVEGIEFCGGGEPAMHPQLHLAVAHGNSLGLKFGILTSGVALSNIFINQAIPTFSYVRFSVDAADEVMFSKTRPTRTSRAWERLLANIRTVIALKNATNPTMEVGIKFVIGAVNVGQIEDMIKLAKSLGASNCQFKALRGHPHELSCQAARAAEMDLNALKLQHAPFRVIGSFEKLKSVTRCVLTPLQVTIDAAGDVFLCCYFAHRKETHRIGNVIQQSFSDLWGGERHRAAIQSIEPSGCNNLDCRFVRYQASAEHLRTSYGAFI